MAELILTVVLFNWHLFLDSFCPNYIIGETPPYNHYHTAEAHRFGVCYYSAALIHDRLDWHIHYYYGFCKDSLTEEDENFLFLLRSMRSVYFHLKESLDKRNTIRVRVYHLHNLKMSLSVFSIGQEYHWYDLGLLPIWH